MANRNNNPQTGDNLLSPEAVDTADRSELLATYHALYRRPPPKHASQRFLRGNVQWALEARNRGKDPIRWRAELIKELEQKVAQMEGKPILSPGTRLVREWQGKVHEVAVTKAGFEWQGKCYASLTAVARAITGQKRSGPKFFGLKSPREWRQ